MKPLHRILIIGTGSIGERHVRCFLATQRATVGIVETNAKLRPEVTARYSLTETFSSLDEALAARWDAALIATPAPSHIPIAARLADAGINLFIEKPLSTSIAGVPELIETLCHKNLVVNVGYTTRAHPGVAALRRELLTGRFGRPVQLVAVSGQHFPFYRPAYRQTYYRDHATGGGAIQDALTHAFNTGEWLVGPIDRLCADAAHQVLDGVAVEDTVNVLTRQGSVMGCYSLNQHQAPNEATTTVICERGTVRFESHTSRLRWMDQPGGEWHDETFALKDRDTLYTLQATAFLDALEGRAAPLCTLAEGAQTLRVNLAALASATQAAGWIAVQ